MVFFVYILVSRDWLHTYVGQTEDVGRRLGQHNAGKVRSTRAYGPWRVLHVEEFETRDQARARELWYKRPTGRRQIAELLRQHKELGERE